MAVNGPVLLVEDDVEEQQKIKKALSEIGLSNLTSPQKTGPF